MSSVTPNIHLVKQAGNEYADNDVTSSNLDILDEEIGKRGKTINNMGPDASGNYKVDEVTFAHQIVADDAQQMSGEFLFRTTGGDVSLEDGPAKLVSMSGRWIHEGIVEESIEMTVNAVPRDEEETQGPVGETGEDEPVIEPDTITAEIDKDVFKAYVDESCTITLTYTDAWSANPTLYGVTVFGTPVAGDEIIIVYAKADRGTITQSTPTGFRSTGWNLYNNSTGLARVKKYSDQYGFLIGGTYTKIEFSTTPEGTKTTISPASGYFNIPGDGYVTVTGGNATTYILMTWSDWGEGYEGDFEAYSETEIDLTDVMENFPNGLMQVGSISDEINFTMGKAISRVTRMAYTAENVAIAEASGREWEADTDYIYIARAEEITYDFESTGDYTASDHGLEIIDGSTVDVFTQTLYGRNLVDYLRHDVPQQFEEITNSGFDFTFTIPASSWPSSSPFTYTWLNSHVTANCRIIANFLTTTNPINQNYLAYSKVSGGVKFTSPSKPTQDIPIIVHIFNVQAAAIHNILGSEVSTSVISGAQNVNEALTAINAKFTNYLAYDTFVLSAGTSVTCSVPNSARALVVFETPTTTAGYNFLAFVNANASGTIRYIVIGETGIITETHTTNSITFTNTSATTGVSAHILKLVGNITAAT